MVPISSLRFARKFAAEIQQATYRETAPAALIPQRSCAGNVANFTSLLAGLGDRVNDDAVVFEETV
jgi:hypothetical protein